MEGRTTSFQERYDKTVTTILFGIVFLLASVLLGVMLVGVAASMVGGGPVWSSYWEWYLDALPFLIIGGAVCGWLLSGLLEMHDAVYDREDDYDDDDDDNYVIPFRSRDPGG